MQVNDIINVYLGGSDYIVLEMHENIDKPKHVIYLPYWELCHDSNNLKRIDELKLYLDKHSSTNWNVVGKLNPENIKHPNWKVIKKIKSMNLRRKEQGYAF